MLSTHSIRRGISALALAAVISAAVASTAVADNIKNYLVNGVGVGNSVTILAGTTTEIPYDVHETGGSCDAADGTPVTVSINVPSEVTATPSHLVFSACGVQQLVTFSAPPGTHNIPAVTATDLDGSYNTGSTSFVLTVQGSEPAATSLNEAPVVTMSSDDVIDGLVEGNAIGGANVSFTASATDAEDGLLAATCNVESAAFFALGNHTITCSATDSEGRAGTATLSFEVVDTTAPALTVPGNIVQTATAATGNIVDFTGLSASDIVDPAPIVDCVDASDASVASGDRLLGTHQITCTATDGSGNQAKASFTVKILFDFPGFHQPIDTDVRNAMRAGATAPMKFRITDGAGGYISDLSAVVMTTSRSFICDNSPEDSLEEYAMGGTALRYDSTDQQFIFNWKSPKLPGTCWQVKLMLADGTARSVTFSLR
jgi:large repetitive protein